MSFFEICSSFAKKHKPSTQYQKKVNTVVTYNGRFINMFPPGNNTPMNYLPELPKEISRLKPTLEECNQEYIEKMIELSKFIKKSDFSPITNMLAIYAFVYLLGFDCTKEMVYLARNGFGSFGVDRMGKPVYFKVKV